MAINPVPGIKAVLSRNITLDGVEYPIAVDSKGRPLFERADNAPDQGGVAGQTVWAVWDRGGQMGMGETRRISPDSMGYAFSEGWDCSAYGFFRLRPTIESVTPMLALANSRTFMFQASPAPQALFNIVSAAKSTGGAPAAQNFAHGLGVVPKALIFYTSGKTNETVSAGLVLSVGFSDTVNDGAIGIASTDNAGTAAQATRRMSGVITIVNGANTVIAEGSVTAVDSTNVEVTWSVNDATATIIHMGAIGGADARAKVVEWQTGTSTGTVPVTGVGFTPSVMLHMAHDLAVTTGAEFDASSTGTDTAVGISETGLTKGGSGTNTSSYATASVSPTANKLQLLTIFNRRDTGTATTPTVTGAGRTWSQVRTRAVGNNRITLFAAEGAGTGTGALTIDFGGTVQLGCAWSLAEFSDVDTASAIVQSASNATSSGTSLTVTLGSFSNALNATYGAFAAFTTDPDPDVSFGFEKIHSLTSLSNSIGALLTEWRPDNATGVSTVLTVSTGDLVGIAVEIKAANATKTVTVSHTCTGSNLALAANFGIAVNRSFSKSGVALSLPSITSVTYNGVAMTQQRTASKTQQAAPGGGGGGPPVSSYIQETIGAYAYSLAAPATGANNIVITLTGGAYDNLSVSVHGESYTGIQQNAPVRSTASQTGTSNSPKVTISTALGDRVTGVHANITSNFDEGTANTAVVTDTPASSPHTSSVTLTSSLPWASVAMSFQPFPVTDALDNMRIALGWMESNGNQGTVGISGEEAGTSNTARQQSTAHCLRGLDPSGAITYALTYASTDTDGFSVNVATAPAASVTVTSLCLAGVRAYAGSFQKPTSAAASAVTGVGFTPGLVMFMQDMTSTTQVSNTAAHARMGISWMDNGTEGAIAVQDTDALDTSSTDGVSKTSKVNVSLDNDTQTVDDEADFTSMDADGFTTTYSTADATASKVLYLALAQLAGDSSDKFVYLLNGTRIYKLKVELDNSITLVNIRDFGGATSLGRPARFEGDWLIPFGPDADFRALTSITTDTSDDTYTVASGSGRALGFATVQDGAIARVARGHSTNRWDMAETVPTTITNFGSDFEISDSSSVIRNMADSGVGLYAAKTDGLYRATPEGVAQQLIISEPDNDNGSGLIVIPQTNIAFYNDLSGLHVVMGDVIALNVGPDGIPYNDSIPGISHEPYRGRHLEMAVIGKWLYSLYAVTEEGVTKTFLLAGNMVELPRGIIWHTLAQFPGSARGLGIFESRVWTQYNGQIHYLRIGNNGAPDAGRDSIGRGDASSTFRLVLGEMDFEYPHTRKQLVRAEINARGVDQTCPIQIQAKRDGGSPENVGDDISSTEVSARFWTAGDSDTCIKAAPVLSVTTTSDYDPALTDLQVESIIFEAVLLPEISDVYHFFVDTGQTLSSGGSVNDARTLYANLAALESANSVALAHGPLGLASTQVNVFKVSNPQVIEVAHGEFHLVVEIWAKERTTA